jgi:hypothetical protein
MPSTSKKQHNFMAAIANNPKFAKKVGIPKATGEEFMKADKGRKFKDGGAAAKKTKRFAEGGITINQPAQIPSLPQPNTGLQGSYPFQGTASADSSGTGVNQTFNMQPQATAGQPAEAMRRGGKIKAKAYKAKAYKAGGVIKSTKTRGCGIATKGLTKGKMV